MRQDILELMDKRQEKKYTEKYKLYTAIKIKKVKESWIREQLEETETSTIHSICAKSMGDNRNSGKVTTVIKVKTKR